MSKPQPRTNQQIATGRKLAHWPEAASQYINTNFFGVLLLFFFTTTTTSYTTTKSFEHDSPFFSLSELFPIPYLQIYGSQTIVPVRNDAFQNPPS
jgi:hypothetical protein